LTYLLSETVMHGYDIAQAAGRKWRIEPAHAAMALGRFIVPIIQALDLRALVNGAKAAGVQATYDVRIRGGDRFHFVFNDGSVRVKGPSSHRVDCHISATRGIPHGGLGPAESVECDRQGQVACLGPQTVAGTAAQGLHAQSLELAAAYPSQRD
jgi:hypothetical protein